MLRLNEYRGIVEVSEESIIIEENVVVFDRFGTFDHFQNLFGFLVSFHEIRVRHQHLEFVEIDLIQSFL